MNKKKYRGVYIYKEIKSGCVMRRRICGMALVGIMLLTACDRQGIQVAETAGRTESDTVYEKMQEEQKKQKKNLKMNLE